MQDIHWQICNICSMCQCIFYTLPHNLRHAVRLEVLVRFAEVAVAEETVVGGEGRGMGGGEHQVLAAVYEGAFALGVGSPEDEDEVFFPVGQQTDDAVGKGFPTVALVRACLVGAYGEGGVEQQHALPGPAGEVACGGWLGAYVVFNFLEDVDERRGERDAIVYREAQPVCLSGAVVRVLAYDDYFHLTEGAEVEGVEYQSARRVDGLGAILLADEVGKGAEIIFVEFRLQEGFPAFFYLYIHND